MFMHGEQNRSLSYLPTLADHDVELAAIPQSGHWLMSSNAPGMWVPDHRVRGPRQHRGRPAPAGILMPQRLPPPASSRSMHHAGYRIGESGYRRITVALSAAGVATFALLYSTQALLPELARVFSVSAAQSTLSLSLTTIGLGVALLVAGPVSEVVGRTRLIHLSLAASAVVALACAVAPTWEVLLGLRLLQGITLAGLPAVATAYLREELHPDTHARAAGLYIGGTALGGMTGRLVTGAVADVADWRWALAAIAVVVTVCALVVWLLLPPSRNFVPAPARLGSLATMTRRALSDRGLLALYAVGACAAGAFVAVYNAMGFRLTSAPFSLGLGTAGLVFLVYPIGSLGSAVAGRLADRFSRRAVVPVGCLVTVAGVLLTLPSSLPVVVLGLAVMTAGFFAVHGVASGWVPSRAHAGGVASGQAASLYLFAYYLGSSVFGSLAGNAWTAGAWPAVIGLASALLLVSGLLALWLRRIPSLDPLRR
jgi:YNFM family putative membrane transporter